MEGLLYCRCEGLPMYPRAGRSEFVCPHCRASVSFRKVEEAILHALRMVLKEEVDYGRLIASALDMAARSGVEVGQLFSEVEGALSLYPDDPVKRRRLMRLMVARVEYTPFQGTLEVAFDFESRTEA
ncbi:MAG: hypothetical protein QJR01_01470 [Kyrpidia sp.]|nr:hypothetical protein [Kyrpidia sp.]